MERCKIFIVREYSDYEQLYLFKNKRTAIEFIEQHGCVTSDLQEHLWFYGVKNMRNFEDPQYVLSEYYLNEE